MSESSEPRESRTNSSLQLLLQTAEKLIAEKGCRKTTLQEIMNDTGLSKGAIYHYVGSKDELFGLVLRERLSSANERFYNAVNEKGSLTEPLHAVVYGMKQMHDEKDVTNRILVYLLNQRDNPVVEKTLKDFYEKSFDMSVQWIEAGQKGGVIPSEIDAHKLGELFLLISYGMRVRGMTVSKSGNFTADDMFTFMKLMLSGGCPL
ncbi:TetR/AcrR family transcriptional regulator [Paenibacillus sp. sptzw28]|uniref:TetR/AcrR family transcriptional regulator n=1 Tax=Paenibacillus sp. sptzw28 TaxID=715179 RepID=UPI001C6E05E0|nr:TetR/AcrR family transcriptional regulator [Paenibacillus sp. sptzw28]QYR19050.1 TetR/AcrR family transcriptional regulator [Paenibacillus sp. sptzw28]